MESFINVELSRLLQRRRNLSSHKNKVDIRERLFSSPLDGSTINFKRDFFKGAVQWLVFTCVALLRT